ASLDFHRRPGALLHRGRARRVLAGRRLGRGGLAAPADLRHRPRVLHARVAHDAAHAGERMTPRFWSLVLKELRQIRRDERLLPPVIVTPVVQLLVFGLALDPEVKNLRVGIVDESRTAKSRDLVSALTENQTLRLHGAYPTTTELERAIADGRLDLGVVVPHEFARQLGRGQTADVQVLINGVHAHTAQLAQGHVQAAVTSLNAPPGAATPPY